MTIHTELRASLHIRDGSFGTFPIRQDFPPGFIFACRHHLVDAPVRHRLSNDLRSFVGAHE
jgi:hypothetical protein